MKKDGLSRRQFNSLTAAAFGGIVTGTIVGCGGKKDKDKGKDGGGKDGKPKDGAAKDGGKTKLVASNPWTGDTHVCRGLNACKGKGAGGDNECAGQGNCHTLADKHTCHKQNDCKYQGGCGESVGNNDCKAKGECGVPLSDETWAKARTSFEAAMKKAGKKFGVAPAKKSG